MNGDRNTFAGALAAAAESLAQAGVESPRLDAELLLATAAGVDRTRLVMDARQPLPEGVRQQFDAFLNRRSKREPIQYILGTREFWSLDFEVTPAVLIPRPETEGLVEAALAVLNGRTDATICDVGTGSGCVAIVLARELPGARVTAVDVSPEALKIAQRNCRRHQVSERVELFESDLLSACSGRRFDVIVSNPPYAARESFDDLPAELFWEPRGALDGGARGIELIARLIDEAPSVLVPGGWLAIEIGFDQSDETVALFAAPGWGPAAVREDLQGLPRVVLAQWRGSDLQ